MSNPVQIISGNEFKKDVGAAQRDALNGPVYIEDQDKLAYVLLNIDEYEKLVLGDNPSLADRLGCPPVIADLDFELPKRRSSPQPASLD